METAYKYPKCTDCVHAHMDKNGNHDCGFMDCVSEQDKEYPDETTFESYLSCYDCLQKYVSAERRIAELEKENAELKGQNKKLLESCEGATMMYEDLCKAKELLQRVVKWATTETCKCEKFDFILADTKQFLKDSEVEK